MSGSTELRLRRIGAAPGQAGSIKIIGMGWMGVNKTDLHVNAQTSPMTVPLLIFFLPLWLLLLGCFVAPHPHPSKAA